ncbi:MAG: DUF72 domain-containing protein [Candidatus Bathyarchaeota archaeon]|nr:MAG: DUF72 domain-containing protein [Candidatus Bathyarchaeota archaeon]
MDNVVLGTSGWSYREWIGPFYAKGVKSMLHAYGRVFKTVEINSTFYRYPTEKMVMGWVRYSPSDFVFTAKLPKLITHEKKLDLAKGVEEDLQRYCETMRTLLLNGKLGCLLIQLPPKYEYNIDQLESFFKILPADFKFAVEFRNLSWLRNETWDLLNRYKVAYTIVDEPLLPPEIHVTSSIAYFRWHGKGDKPWFNYRYSKEELDPWIPKVNEVSRRARKVYGYFNNHFHGYAPENCLQVLEMLGMLEAGQQEAMGRVKRHRQRPKQTTLGAFG